MMAQEMNINENGVIIMDKKLWVSKLKANGPTKTQQNSAKMGLCKDTVDRKK